MSDQSAPPLLKIGRYISLLSAILKQCIVEDNAMGEVEDTKSEGQVLPMNRRVGIFMPSDEGAFVDSSSVVRSAAIVAASVVEAPVQR